MNHGSLGYTDEWLSKRVKDGIQDMEYYRINLSMMDFDIEMSDDRHIIKGNEMMDVKTVVFSQDGIFINSIPKNRIFRGIKPERPVYRILVKALAVFGYIYLSDDIRLYVVNGEDKSHANNFLIKNIKEDDLMSIDETSIPVVSVVTTHNDYSPASELMTMSVLSKLVEDIDKKKGD